MAKFGGYGGGGINMQQMMRQAQKMQQEMAKAKEELENLTVVGSAGGGMVEVELSGTREVERVTIKPEAVDPDDVEMLEDLITAAANEAYAQADELVKNSPLGQLGGGF